MTDEFNHEADHRADPRVRIINPTSAYYGEAGEVVSLIREGYVVKLASGDQRPFAKDDVGDWR